MCVSACAWCTRVSRLCGHLCTCICVHGVCGYLCTCACVCVHVCVCVSLYTCDGASRGMLSMTLRFITPFHTDPKGPCPRGMSRCTLRPDPSKPRAVQLCGSRRGRREVSDPGRAGPHIHVGQVPRCYLRLTPPCPAHLPGSHLVTLGGIGRSQWVKGHPLGVCMSRRRVPWEQGSPEAWWQRPTAQPDGRQWDHPSAAS